MGPALCCVIHSAIDTQWDKEIYIKRTHTETHANKNYYSSYTIYEQDW